MNKLHWPLVIVCLLCPPSPGAQGAPYYQSRFPPEEFKARLRNHGIPRDLRARFDEQSRRSLAKGLWRNSYAGSNPDEFFAELTMWYFGTHGDLHMTGPKPENGPAGLEQYDSDAYALLDDFYSGRIEITRVEPIKPRRRSGADNPDSAPPAAGAAASNETRRH